MAQKDDTYKTPKAPPTNSKDLNPHLIPTHEWLEDWQIIKFPLRNGGTLGNYKPKIEKYIKDWIDLYNDVDLNGKKFKMKDLTFVPVGSTNNEFRVVANPEEIHDPLEVIGGQAMKKTNPGGGGVSPGEKPDFKHLIPPPPPPPK